MGKEDLKNLLNHGKDLVYSYECGLAPDYCPSKCQVVGCPMKCGLAP